MNRIFKISGNFKQGGEWAKPNPAFSGKIVLDEEKDQFRGYCEELYCSSDQPEPVRFRILAGLFSEGRSGIAFYKLSSDYTMFSPLIYVVPDLDDPERASAWYAFDPFSGGFSPIEPARAAVEEETYSKDEEMRILNRYDELRVGETALNHDLLLQINRLGDMLEHAE